MKKFLSIFIFLLTSLVSIAQESFDLDALLKSKPNPPKLVNDYTRTLTEDQRQTLENKLVAFDDSTSTQIAVVIIPTLNGRDVADYNIELGRAWGVGGKDNNNGIVLLIVNGDPAKGDRKLNIAVGYGLEGALPDVTAKQIIDQIIVPNFKGQDYYRGIEEGTDAIIQAVKGEYTAPENYGKSKGSTIGNIIFLIILIVIFLAISRGKGGGGSFMSRRGVAAWTIGNLIGGGGGGSSSGGGSSGGFGGFGGGSFGGGGASGSW